MDLTLLAPGARRNEGGGLVQNRQGYTQTNVDGQQITTNYHSTPDSEQAQISRDAIAEFQVVANRFDATQGRSSGMVVNAITKSGTNPLTGTFGGYFRNDSLNAKDFILHRVLPYSNQQLSTTVGGPIVRDRLHFFVSYEFEHEPRTFNANSVYAFLNRDVTYPKKQHTATERVDWQISPADAPDRPCLRVPHGFLQRWLPDQPDWRHSWTHRAAVLRHTHASLRHQCGQRNQGRSHRLRAAGPAGCSLEGRTTSRIIRRSTAARSSPSLRASPSGRRRSTSSRTTRRCATTTPRRSTRRGGTISRWAGSTSGSQLVHLVPPLRRRDRRHGRSGAKRCSHTADVPQHLRRVHLEYGADRRDAHGRPVRHWCRFVRSLLVRYRASVRRPPACVGRLAAGRLEHDGQADAQSWSSLRPRFQRPQREDGVQALAARRSAD